VLYVLCAGLQFRKRSLCLGLKGGGLFEIVLCEPLPMTRRSDDFFQQRPIVGGQVPFEDLRACELDMREQHEDIFEVLVTLSVCRLPLSAWSFRINRCSGQATQRPFFFSA